MGFGGGALAANQVIRNNRNLLRNKRKVGKLEFVSAVNEKWEDPKKASFEQLQRIKKRTLRNRKNEFLKLVVFTILGLVLLIVIITLIPWGLIFTNVH